MLGTTLSYFFSGDLGYGGVVLLTVCISEVYTDMFREMKLILLSSISPGDYLSFAISSVSLIPIYCTYLALTSFLYSSPRFSMRSSYS